MTVYIIRLQNYKFNNTIIVFSVYEFFIECRYFSSNDIFNCKYFNFICQRPG